MMPNLVLGRKDGQGVTVESDRGDRLHISVMVGSSGHGGSGNFQALLYFFGPPDIIVNREEIHESRMRLLASQQGMSGTKPGSRKKGLNITRKPGERVIVVFPGEIVISIHVDESKTTEKGSRQSTVLSFSAPPNIRVDRDEVLRNRGALPAPAGYAVVSVPIPFPMRRMKRKGASQNNTTGVQ